MACEARGTALSSSLASMKSRLDASLFMVLALITTIVDVGGFTMLRGTQRWRSGLKRARSSTRAFVKSPALEDLSASAAAYAAQNGIIMRSGSGYDVAPFSLLPQKFPRAEFDRAVAMARCAQGRPVAVSRRGDCTVLSCLCCNPSDPFLLFASLVTRLLLRLMQLDEQGR